MRYKVMSEGESLTRDKRDLLLSENELRAVSEDISLEAAIAEAEANEIEEQLREAGLEFDPWDPELDVFLRTTTDPYGYEEVQNVQILESLDLDIYVEFET